MYKYLVLIDPLGFLYASSGPFLSPENLVGLAGQNFPPSSTTFAGLMAAHLSEKIEGDADCKLALEHLFVAGPFWSFKDRPQDFCVPTPFCFLSTIDDESSSASEVSDLPIATGTVQRLYYRDHGDDPQPQWSDEAGNRPSGKFDKQTWISLKEWDTPSRVFGNPWKFIPHLHPRLREDERRVMVEAERGSLFLENAVQLNPNVCLVYLSNTPIDDGWYRFGGEGHMVQVTCEALDAATQERFSAPLGNSFATITAGIWGSNRFSRRYPVQWDDLEGVIQIWTERAKTFRFRLGGQPNKVKRLSRGRYAVPPGTVYQLPEAIDAWQEWAYYDHAPSQRGQPIAEQEIQNVWFPTEGYSFKHWGCGLALPLEI